jgi:DNA-binding NtrC family response regulator
MLHRPKVLIIQNDLSACTPLRRLVEEQGAVPVFTCAVAEGVRFCKGRGPDAVILDLRLPEGGGLDAFRQIHAASPCCPVVLVTAPDDGEVSQQAMREGAFDWLAGPVARDRLGEVLGRALGTAGQGLKSLIASLQRAGENDLYNRAVQALEQALLSEILRQTDGNQKRASEILGIDRKTLRKKLLLLGLIPGPVGAA